MQMDHLPSHEVEAPIPIRSAFVVGVGRGFGAGNGSDGGGGGGPSSYPSNNHHHHHHVVHHHLAGTTVTAAAASSVVTTPTIPKEERPCDSSSPPSSLPPSPPHLTLPVLVANGPRSPPPPPPPAVLDANHGSTHVIPSCKGAVAPPPPPESSSSNYVYRECLRNHAASLGGNATDGCGEFMPGDAASGDALLCSACGCHRNFHRKELAGGGGAAHRPYGTGLLGRGAGAGSYYHPQQHVQYLTGRKVVGQKGVLISTAAPCTALVPYRQPPPQQHHPHHAPTAMAIPLHAAVPAPESDQEMDQLVADGGGPGVLSGMYHTNVGAGHYAPALGMPPGFGKKRFRTKFTTEQKKRMLAFAERVGWRLQRRDEAEVQGFCQEIGVKRRVLKVWMHNNKHNRRNLSYGGIFPTIITNSDGASIGDDHHDENSVIPHEARNHDHNGRDLNQGNHHHHQLNHHNGVAGAVNSPPSHPQPLQHHHHQGVATAASPQSHPQPLQHHHQQHPAGSVIQVEE